LSLNAQPRPPTAGNAAGWPATCIQDTPSCNPHYHAGVARMSARTRHLLSCTPPAGGAASKLANYRNLPAAPWAGCADAGIGTKVQRWCCFGQPSPATRSRHKHLRGFSPPVDVLLATLHNPATMVSEHLCQTTTPPKTPATGPRPEACASRCLQVQQ
jgi:hypothetical protein